MNGKSMQEINQAFDVLLVDDETDFLRSLADGLLHCAGEFNIVTAESAKKALAFLQVVMVDVVVMDPCMPGMDGFELLHHLQQLQQSHPGMKIIIMSAHDRASVKNKIKGTLFTHYFKKPFELGDLTQAILDRRRRPRVAA